MQTVLLLRWHWTPGAPKVEESYNGELECVRPEQQYQTSRSNREGVKNRLKKNEIVYSSLVQGSTVPQSSDPEIWFLQVEAQFSTLCIASR